MDTNKKDRAVNTNTEAKNFQALYEKEISSFNKVFTKRLKAARKEKDYTHKDMAEKLGISLDTYRKYEHGENRRDMAFILHSLAETLDVSADYLVGRSKHPHPEYKEMIAETGLNERAIAQLCKLHRLDGAEDGSPGYMDFVNCFLGNEDSTGLFFEALTPMLRTLNEAIYGEYQSSGMTEIATAQLARHVMEYIEKVVVPTYGQLYHEGHYASADVSQYLTDDAVKKRK